MNRAARALLVLLAAAFFCYGGPKIVSLGFYLDDWILLSYMRFAPAGFFARVAAMIATGPSYLFRPLDAPLIAGLYGLFGLHPTAWQFGLLVANALMAFVAGRIMLRFGVSERMALLGSIFCLAWPNKDATMLWPLTITNSLSLLAMLTAYLAHLEYVEGGRKRFLGASVALTLVSLGLYDQCFFFFLLWPLTPRLFQNGVAPRAKRGALAAAAASAAFLLYKFVFVPRVLGIHYNKTFVFSPAHFLWVYLAGAESSVGPRLLAFSARSLLTAFRVSPLIAAAAVLYPWIILKLPESETKARRDAALALIALGALIFLLGYLPIAVSDYSPTPLNEGNRVNEVPVMGLILAAFGLAARALKTRKIERSACAFASVLLAVHVGLSCYWVESYRRQNVVRDQVLANLSRWPANKRLLLLLPERYVAGKVAVFEANYDITGAVRIWTDDQTREADTISPRLPFTPDGLLYPAGLVPYSSMLLLDSARDSLTTFDFQDVLGKARKP